MSGDIFLALDVYKDQNGRERYLNEEIKKALKLVTEMKSREILANQSKKK